MTSSSPYNSQMRCGERGLRVIISILQRRKLSLGEWKPLVPNPVAKEQPAYAHHWVLLTPEATWRALWPPAPRHVQFTHVHKYPQAHTLGTPANPQKAALLIVNSSAGLIQEVWGIYKHSFCTYSRLETAQHYDCISNLGPMRLMHYGWVRFFYPGVCALFPSGQMQAQATASSQHAEWLRSLVSD